MPDTREQFKIESKEGPIELKTSFSREVGMMSNGLVDVLVVLTNSDRDWSDMGVKESKIDGRIEQACGAVVEGIMPALTLSTLSTKNWRKSLQSLIEKTGQLTICGLTMWLIVSKRTFGFLLLAEIKLLK